jgi:hypothetical protein
MQGINHARPVRMSKPQPDLFYSPVWFGALYRRNWELIFYKEIQLKYMRTSVK